MPQLHARGESVIQNIRKRGRQQHQKNDATAAPAAAPKQRYSRAAMRVCTPSSTLHAAADGRGLRCGLSRTGYRLQQHRQLSTLGTRYR